MPPGTTLDLALAAKVEPLMPKSRPKTAKISVEVTPHAATQPVGKRARALLRDQLKHGPKPAAQIEAAAKAAKIPERALLAAADALGVRSKRGEWRLPG